MKFGKARNRQRIGIKKKRKVVPLDEKLSFKDVNWEKVAKIFEPEKEAILHTLRKETDRYPRSCEVLYLLGAGVLLGGTILFPGLPQVVAPLVGGWEGYRRGRLSQTIKRFKDQKLVTIEEKNGEQIVIITKNGIVRALKYKLEEMKIRKTKIWDKKWRLIIFDIPEKKKWFREIFRERLKILGLYRLQESVYVYPYPCFDEIEFLRQIYRVPFDVKYVVAEKIEEQADLRTFFDL